MSWATSEGLNEKYSFFNNMMEGYHRALVREKRFVVSGPIIIATAIGIFSATSAVSASYVVARSETNRIAHEQNILRLIDSDNAIQNNLLSNNVSIEIAKSIDTLRYITALSAQITNEFHNAVQLMHKINHIFNEDKILLFNDPASERWYSSTEHIVNNNDNAHGYC